MAWQEDLVARSLGLETQGHDNKDIGPYDFVAFETSTVPASDKSHKTLLAKERQRTIEVVEVEVDNGDNILCVVRIATRSRQER